MVLILFLVDTSASMNQKTYLGTSYLDVAKVAIETFMKVGPKPVSRTDLWGRGIVVEWCTCCRLRRSRERPCEAACPGCTAVCFVYIVRSEWAYTRERMVKGYRVRVQSARSQAGNSILHQLDMFFCFHFL